MMGYPWWTDALLACAALYGIAWLFSNRVARSRDKPVRSRIQLMRTCLFNVNLIIVVPLALLFLLRRARRGFPEYGIPDFDASARILLVAGMFAVGATASFGILELLLAWRTRRTTGTASAPGSHEVTDSPEPR